MNLALFDLDNTLIDGDSDYEWGNFLCAVGAVDAQAQRAQNNQFMRDYENGTLNVHEFLRFQFAPLKQHSRAQLEKWHAQFLKEKILPLILPKGKKVVQAHQQAGDVVVLVSATNTFVVAPIARILGIEHVASTIAAQDEHGHFTGQVRGEPAFQSGKIKRVELWMEAQGFFWDFFEKTFFYSDSFNDLPLLQRVTHPCAVNPDARLLKFALEKGWRVENFRNQDKK